MDLINLITYVHKSAILIILSKILRGISHTLLYPKLRMVGVKRKNFFSLIIRYTSIDKMK